MTSLGRPARLRASPELLPLDLDPATDAVTVLELSRLDYERASFLDGRLNLAPAWRPDFAELSEAARGLPIAADFIFHIGHVGSTLLSRLLGFHPAVFSLREPQALRTFARAAPWSPEARARRLAVFMALYSRTWTPGQRALVKATSLVSEVAGELLSLEAGARGLILTVRPATYVATILGGPNSRLELAAAAPARLGRLSARLQSDLGAVSALSEGELAAASWGCEVTALAQAARAHEGRVAWLDFDRFLEDPAAGLSRALAFLHGQASPEDVERLLRSGFLTRYSKAPTYAYGPETRAEVLAQAQAESGAEIARGLAWLDAMAGRHPAIQGALHMTQAIHDA